MALILMLWCLLQFDEPDQIQSWLKKQEHDRAVVDRVVVCFDEGAVLQEIARWTDERYWPVLLWDSDLVPKFLREFEPAEVLLAPPTGEKATIPTAIEAMSKACALEETPKGSTSFLKALRAKKRAPMGAVLLSENSDEFIGGIALVAGRYQLPYFMETGKKPTDSVVIEHMDMLRKKMIADFTAMGIEFAGRFDDLDFITVANDLPFGYTQSDEAVHPGGYTIDDAIARNDDHTRWAWVGRLMGGPARSLYMAMGSLFLQPKRGLFWSRYNPNNAAFGVFDPESSVKPFSKFFPTEAIRHPDATLDRWCRLQWPNGNRFGFLYVNSSGGAKQWSTSKGQASYFDVPDTIPAVVHYTHSGSAGRPFDVDTIAGRWLANGAYIYFGSYSEPYLNAFVPPSVLAERVTAGIPLGAAMRHPYNAAGTAQRTMKVKGAERTVSFNMTGPWKLAYFGDPMYRLTAEGTERVSGEGKGDSLTVKEFLKLKGKKRGLTAEYAVAATSIGMVDVFAVPKLDEKRASKMLKAARKDELRDRVLGEVIQVWVEALRTIPEDERYQPKYARKAMQVPKIVQKAIAAGATSPEGARLMSEYAKSYLAGLFDETIERDKRVGIFVLELLCCLPHSKSSRKDVYRFVSQTAPRLGIEPAELREAILEHKWLPKDLRKTITSNIK